LRIDPARRPTGRDLLRRLDGERGARGESAATAVAPAMARDAPFVGREHELVELRRAFADSRTGRAVTVLVHGESGVGKTTLVRRLVDELTSGDSNSVLLTGRCYERESVPYKALDEVVDGLSRHVKRLPAVEAAALLPRMASLLTHVFPVLLDVEPFAQAPRLQHEVADPQELRARVFAALREMLTRLGDRHPLVIVIDDLQWADADSLALLAEVLRPPLAPTLLLLATVRTASEPSSSQRSLLDQWMPLLGEVRHLWLENLPRAEARRLVTLLVDRPDADGRLNLDAIADESEGHPLFIDALVRHRLSHGDTTATLRLEEALWSRMEALPPTERKLLELVAVAGRPQTQAVVARAAGLDLGTFSEAATHLRRANFVRTDGVRSTDAIEPYHDKVRAAVRGNLEPARLAQCYERLAIAVESSGTGDPEALAVYWHGAGDAGRGAEHALVAAARAVKALAFDQAARLYRTALEWRPADGVEGRDIRARLADALAQAGRGAEAAEAFRAAAGMASGAEQMELKRRAAEQLLLSGHVDEGLSEVGAVLATVGLKLPRTPRRAMLSFLYHRARLKLRGLHFRERDLGDLPPRLLKVIDLSFSVAQGLIWVDVLRGAEFQTRVIRLALDAGEPTRLTRALALEAGFAATAGGDGPKRAIVLLKTAEEMARRRGEPQPLGLVLGASGFAALARQSYREARDLNAQAEEILSERCVGAFWELALVRTNLLFSIGLVGDLGDLAIRGHRYVRAAQDRGDLLAATSMVCGPMSLLPLCNDDPARARLTVDEAMARWSQQGFHLQHLYALSSHTQVDLYEGRFAEAHRRMVDAWPQLERAWFLHLLVTRCWMRELRARTAVAAAQRASGSERARLLADAEKLARSLEKEQLPGTLAHAASTRAGIAAVRGDKARALVDLDETIRRYDAAHMAMQAAIARFHRARLAGGGAALQEAEGALGSLGVRAPARLAAALSPIAVD
jgi:tetratricopeptide (TPR) repeat protein